MAEWTMWIRSAVHAMAFAPNGPLLCSTWQVINKAPFIQLKKLHVHVQGSLI